MKLLVITGGRHPYEESTPVLEGFLKSAGHDVTATEDASVLADGAGMSSYDALVFNTRRENAADFAEMKLSAAEQNGIINYVKSGKGFVCLHISGCGADYWSEFAEITGGGWVTGTSYHPPYGNFPVKVSNAGHAGVAGVSDFSTDDELYMGIDYKDGNDIFLALDESSFVYRDRTGRTPLEHIEENAKVLLLFRHSEQQVGWKFRCTANVYREGPVYEDSINRLFESGLITDPESKTAAVVLQVDQVLTLFGEVLQEREPGLQW